MSLLKVLWVAVPSCLGRVEMVASVDSTMTEELGNPEVILVVMSADGVG